jgi:membrane protein YdbS with pleckstrin-like domain
MNISSDSAASDTTWQMLPVRARRAFVLGDIGAAVPLLGIGFGIAAAVTGVAPASAAALAGGVLGTFVGMVTGRHRHRHTRWRLDADGLAVARGRWWQRETCVPGVRVQHLDLRHGPLERRWRLATLVVHTAGTRLSAVTLAGLDAAEAERLRDALARPPEADGDAL